MSEEEYRKLIEGLLTFIDCMPICVREVLDDEEQELYDKYMKSKYPDHREDQDD
jgi:hypothetical protein